MHLVWWGRVGLLISIAGALLLSAPYVKRAPRAFISRLAELVEGTYRNPYRLRVLIAALIIGALLGLVVAGAELAPGIAAQGLSLWQAWAYFATMFILGLVFSQIPAFFIWRQWNRRSTTWRLLVLPLALPGLAVLFLYLLLGFAVLVLPAFGAVYTVAVTRAIAGAWGFSDSVGGVGAFLLALGGALQLLGTF